MKTQIELLDIEKVKKYLSKKDKVLGQLLEIAPDFNLQPSRITSVYQSLIESIISQQLSIKAANTIFRRLLISVGSHESIRPLDIIRADDEEIRNLGVSAPKLKAIRALTEFEISGKLPNIQLLEKLSNQEIIDLLCQIKGIGPWTIEMMLIFKLGRQDVISANDLGLRKGFAILQRTYPNILTKEEMLDYAEKHWKPYRSVASWYLWRLCEAF